MGKTLDSSWTRADVIAIIAVAIALASITVSIKGCQFEATPVIVRICRISNLGDYKRPVDQAVFLVGGKQVSAFYPVDGQFPNGYAIPTRRRFLECSITNDGRLAVTNVHISMPIVWDANKKTGWEESDIIEIPALAVGQSYYFDVVNLTGVQIDWQPPDRATLLTAADIGAQQNPESSALFPNDRSLLFNPSGSL